MKVKELLEKANEEINTEQEQAITTIIKRSLKTIKSCERTLRGLKETHEKIMETDIDDIDDIELDSYEY